MTGQPPETERQLTGGEPSPELADIEVRMRRLPIMTLVIAGVMLAVDAAQTIEAHSNGGRHLLLLALGVVPERLQAGEYWRAVSGTWLHGSWLHFGVNVIALLFAGRLAEAAYGPTAVWVLFACSGFGGVLGTMLSGHAVSVGASGAIFGLLGALLAAGVRLWGRMATRTLRLLVVIPSAVFGATLAAAWIEQLMEQQSVVDNAAHVAGALVGGAIGSWWPLALRPGEARTAVPSPARQARPGLRWSGAAVLASGLALVHIGGSWAGISADRAPLMMAANVRNVRVDDVRLPIPADYPRGIWRNGSCEGKLSPTAWALQTDRTACFELPLGGWLLLGQRAALLTMDEGDDETMRAALASGRFAHRQPGVMLYPLGERWLYVLVAAESLHPSYDLALAGLLQQAGKATIAPYRPSQPAARPPGNQIQSDGK